ncbi:hypothetical protein GCM10022222_51990 [Amycolatopsis ultiminotia]|uniref:ATP-grasp target RiPP n=1 Tax=Amycolatopsis ultiminotia TaxID=543629 RepID=A0ABP6X9P6_9PSEU
MTDATEQTPPHDPPATNPNTATTMEPEYYRETGPSTAYFTIHPDGHVEYHRDGHTRPATVLTADTVRSLAESGSLQPTTTPPTA